MNADDHIEKANALFEKMSGSWNSEHKTEMATQALAHVAMATYIKEYGESGGTEPKPYGEVPAAPYASY